MTMAPALAVLALGLDPTTTLVISPVVLSFGIPFAFVPLVQGASMPGDGHGRRRARRP